MSAGYSGTPLAKKLGFKAGSRAFALGAPADYLALLAPLPEGVVFDAAFSSSTDIAHLFTTSRSELAALLAAWRPVLQGAGVLWVSWPKKTAKVATEVDEDVIRALALPLGYVDVKVCAVDATWSGLKLVIRKSLR